MVSCHLICFSQISQAWWTDDVTRQKNQNLLHDIPIKMNEPPWNDPTALANNLTVNTVFILNMSRRLNELYQSYSVRRRSLFIRRKLCTKKTTPPTVFIRF